MYPNHGSIGDQFNEDLKKHLKDAIGLMRQEISTALDNIQFIESQCNKVQLRVERHSRSFQRMILDFFTMIGQYITYLSDFNKGVVKAHKCFSHILGPTPSEYSSTSNVSLNQYDSAQDIRALSANSQRCNLEPETTLTDNLINISLNDNVQSTSTQALPIQPESSINTDILHNNAVSPGNSPFKISSTRHKLSLLDTSNNDIVDLGVDNLKTFTPEVNKTTLFDIPAQEVLKVGFDYHGTVTWVENPDEFYITVDLQGLQKLIDDMTSYYKDKKNYKKIMSYAELQSNAYFACYNSSMWFRAVVSNLNVDNNSKFIECYLVDTGKSKVTMNMCNIQILAPQFYHMPVFARLCHLSNVKPRNENNEIWPENASDFLKQYIEADLTAQIDENETESLGVTLRTCGTQIESTINTLLVQKGLACYVSSNGDTRTETCSRNDPGIYHKETNEHIPDEPEDTEEEVVPMGSTEEYYDPLLAVQGYQNRDEIDICKHFKGPPHTTCFKGKNCTKRHEVIDPNGWTHDKKSIYTSTLGAMLYPQSGSKISITVTNISSDRIIMGQILGNNPIVIDGRIVNVPSLPNTLKGLLKSMNTPNALPERPNCGSPAVGELVSCIYSDKCWYRAKVLDHVNATTVQVMYVDYGTITQVQWKDLRGLDVGHLLLPFQAVKFQMVDVGPPRDCAGLFGYKLECKKYLDRTILNREVTAEVLGSYEAHVDVILFDEQGIRIAENLHNNCGSTILPVNYDFDYSNKLSAG